MHLRKELHVFTLVILFVLLVALQSWKTLAAYISAVVMFWNHAMSDVPHWLVLTWFSYSFTFWAIGYDGEDNILFLTITSLIQVSAILLSHTIPSLLESPKEIVALISALVLMIPFRCNNLHYSPVIGMARLASYFLLPLLDAKRHWITRQYPLFGTEEVVLFLFVWHLFVWIRERTTLSPPQKTLLPVAAAENVHMEKQLEADFARELNNTN
jgi:hypothetical protein